MKNHTRLPLLVTAAVFALTACTPVADSAPAAEPATTPEATTEPTSKPAAAETGPLYTSTAMRRMLSMMSCPPLMTSLTISERKFTKTT